MTLLQLKQSFISVSGSLCASLTSWSASVTSSRFHEVYGLITSHRVVWLFGPWSTFKAPELVLQKTCGVSQLCTLRKMSFVFWNQSFLTLTHFPFHSLCLSQDLLHLACKTPISYLIYVLLNSPKGVEAYLFYLFYFIARFYKQIFKSRFVHVYVHSSIH